MVYLFDSNESFERAKAVLKAEGVRIFDERDDVDAFSAQDHEDDFIKAVLSDLNIADFTTHEDVSDEHGQFRSDVEADADALESAGYGEGEHDFDERL